MHLNHAEAHPVFRGIFGEKEYMEEALQKMITGQSEFDELVKQGVRKMVQHEQTLILQPLMYAANSSGA